MKPASAEPSTAAASESPSVKPTSPLPPWIRLRFSTEPLVACTDGRVPGTLSVSTFEIATPSG